MQRQPGALRQLAQEARDDIEVQPADMGTGEVDVRDDERPSRRFDGDVRERLVRGDRARAVAAGARVVQGRAQRLAERAPGRRHLLVRPARRDLEPQPEAAVAREQVEQVVEHRQPRRHGGLAAVDRRAHLQPWMRFAHAASVPL